MFTKLTATDKARINVNAPVKTFLNEDTLQALIDVITGVAYATKTDSLSHLFKPFNKLADLLPEAFILTPATRIILLSFQQFKDTMYQRAPIAKPGAHTLGFCVPSTKPEVIEKYITRNLTQSKQGNIFALQNISGFTGIEVAEFVEWLGRNEAMLQGAASQLKLSDELQKALAMLRSAKILPTDAYYLQESASVVKLGDLNRQAAFLDFNENPQGTFYPIGKADVLLAKVDSGFGKADGQDPSLLQGLKGREVVMIGLPPTGWSTAKFQQALEPLDITLVTKFSYTTKGAFYNPAQETGDKIKAAKDAGITMVPYDQVVAAIQAM